MSGTQQMAVYRKPLATKGDFDMATAKKVSRKELKQPDEFLSFSARAIEYAQLHSRELMIGIASIVVLSLFIWAWTVYKEKKEATASQLVAQAQSLWKPSFPGEATGQAGIAPPRKDPEAENRAREILEDVIDNYRRTSACPVARILLGQIYYENGEYDKAIATYEDFLKSGSQKPELTALAWEGLAYSYEAKEDFTKALGSYEELTQMPLTNVQGWAYLGLARCYERLQEYEKALDAYRTLLASQPQHPKAPEAKAAISRITHSLED
jgi:tetratricopeptide (TPR) repeat protein